MLSLSRCVETFKVIFRIKDLLCRTTKGKGMIGCYGYFHGGKGWHGDDGDESKTSTSSDSLMMWGLVHLR